MSLEDILLPDSVTDYVHSHVESYKRNIDRGGVSFPFQCCISAAHAVGMSTEPREVRRRTMTDLDAIGKFADDADEMPVCALASPLSSSPLSSSPCDPAPKTITATLSRGAAMKVQKYFGFDIERTLKLKRFSSSKLTGTGNHQPDSRLQLHCLDPARLLR
jgi:hypothetical protein